MRKCLRCGANMKEGFELKIQASLTGISIAHNNKLFSERIGSPKMAICPTCGEISYYIEDVARLDNLEQ